MRRPSPQSFEALHAPSEDYPIMVLLIDDQVMVGEAVRRALATEADMELHYCANPGQALALAQKIKPTVILQDLVMPGFDGMSLVRAYRADPATRDIPVIVLSTKEEPLVKKEAFAAGINDYLVKLPDAIELIARIRHHSRAYLNQLQRDEAYRALRESQRKLLEINAELQRLTNVDGLTGLSNRRFFDEYMDMEWRRAIREQTMFCVLMIDVDDFKKYNDSYGHLAGDDVLRQVGGAIQYVLRRPADLGVRFGGEEFTIVLPATQLEGAQVVGEELLRRIAGIAIEHRASTVGAHVTVSIGGAGVVPARNSEHLELLGRADQALYEAKHGGKNRLVLRAPS